MSRRSVWGATLGSPLTWVVNAVIAVLAWSDSVTRIFPETESLFNHLAFLNDLPLHWKIIVLLGANIFLVVEGAARVIRKEVIQRNEYHIKLKQIEEARPHIVLREPEAAYIAPVDVQAVGNVMNTVSFMAVRFVNQPQGPYPNSVARDVRVKLRFFEPIPAGRLLLAIDGRWADTDQPSIRDWRRSPTDPLRMEFGIEEGHSLDIAFRDDQTGEFYAFNNENFHYPLMKKPEHLLVGQHFMVRITLLGPWVNETFEFQFANDSGRTKIVPHVLAS
ncbi:MAG: hypothetical protein DMG80_01880 [Acidobacteria bacterium]|nr:MAG: hypothetical protein DMG80_01880 [Acidobacteriota bacterium]